MTPEGGEIRGYGRGLYLEPVGNRRGLYVELAREIDAGSNLVYPDSGRGARWKKMLPPIGGCVGNRAVGVPWREPQV